MYRTTTQTIFATKEFRAHTLGDIALIRHRCGYRVNFPRALKPAARVLTKNYSTEEVNIKTIFRPIIKIADVYK